MDYTLQIHNAKYVFPIPDGLKELTSDIIREVLRHQPENLNGFIADYLESMMIVRENARDANTIIYDVLTQGFFINELFRTKNITREQANVYATIIQAHWRGYCVRKRLSEWLNKKKKIEEEKEIKRALKIEEYLAQLGITYEEATRAAGIIQDVYGESKRGRWIINEWGKSWLEEVVPFQQRIREMDRALGRLKRWDKQDFGEFFEMDSVGRIKYIWPRIGQLRKVLREKIPDDVGIVEFFGMRDSQGHEQYSYLVKNRPGVDTRGVPIGFMLPVPKSCFNENSIEVEFVAPEDIYKMGQFTFEFRDDLDRAELEKLDDMLKEEIKPGSPLEICGESECDPYWIMPRVLVRMKKGWLQETDHEVRFISLPTTVTCEQEKFTFRAETVEQTSKIIRHILRNDCLTVQEGLLEASNMSPYKSQQVGRIFAVDLFSKPDYIQKIEIEPESATGEEESMNLMNYEYIFVPPNYTPKRRLPKEEPVVKIPIVRFQGYHSDFQGSSTLENKVFILGPKLPTTDGKPLTYDSLFWNEYGEESWNQLLYQFYEEEDARAEELEEELEEEMTEESKPDDDVEAEDIDEVVKQKPYEKERKRTSKSSRTYERKRSTRSDRSIFSSKSSRSLKSTRSARSSRSIHSQRDSSAVSQPKSRKSRLSESVYGEDRKPDSDYTRQSSAGASSQTTKRSSKAPSEKPKEEED